MKIFLDANIIVSVLNKEYPLFTYTSRIVSLAAQPEYQVCTSPLCLAIAYYFSEKKSGAKEAQRKINLLLQHIQVTTVDHDIVQQAMENSKVKDFEDGMEYYSAIRQNCTYIITEDVKDFYFSDIPVMYSEDFLKHLSAKSKR